MRIEGARGSQPADSSATADGTTVYGALIKQEIAAQDVRKASFEQRGIAVITSSGVLATLLFGLAALSTKESATFALPRSAGDLLVVALVCFVVAAALALGANLPLRYHVVKPDEIRKRLKEKPVRSAPAAERDVALTLLKVLESAKRTNRIKARLLVGALAAEVVALGFVAVAIRIVIAG